MVPKWLLPKLLCVCGNQMNKDTKKVIFPFPIVFRFRFRSFEFCPFLVSIPGVVINPKHANLTLNSVFLSFCLLVGKPGGMAMRSYPRTIRGQGEKDLEEGTRCSMQSL